LLSETFYSYGRRTQALAVLEMSKLMLFADKV
jgi:hypothetical protein